MEQARTSCGHAADLDKNSLFIAEWLELAWQAGQKSATLVRLCEALLSFAARTPHLIASAPAAAEAKATGV
jgi:hypothetical protein